MGNYYDKDVCPNKFYNISNSLYNMGAMKLLLEIPNLLEIQKMALRCLRNLLLTGLASSRIPFRFSNSKVKRFPNSFVSVVYIVTIDFGVGGIRRFKFARYG